jgi:protein gp37
LGKDTLIQWTRHTFNPWRGCTKVSPGCTHCYAETLSKRNPAILGRWGPAGTRVVASESKWREPLAWDKAAKLAGERHRVFCASLADVFEDWDGPMVGPNGYSVYILPDGRWWPSMAGGRPSEGGLLTMGHVRERLFRLIRATPNLDWQLLTKRPENIARFWPVGHEFAGPGATEWPSVWLGTSVEDQAAADERIPHLLDIPAAVRFLSMEPLLGDVYFESRVRGYQCHLLSGEMWSPAHAYRPIRGIDWVIVGGESGSKARPFDLAWARSIRDQCQKAGAAFFMKQMGARPFDSRGADGFPAAHKVCGDPPSAADLAAMAISMELMVVDLKGSHGGDWDEWPVDLRVRQMPKGSTTNSLDQIADLRTGRIGRS